MKQKNKRIYKKNASGLQKNGKYV